MINTISHDTSPNLTLEHPLKCVTTVWQHANHVWPPPTCPAPPPAGSKQHRPLCSPVHSALWWCRWRRARSRTLPLRAHLGAPRGRMTSLIPCTPCIAMRETHKTGVSKGTLNNLRHNLSFCFGFTQMMHRHIFVSTTLVVVVWLDFFEETVLHLVGLFMLTHRAASML